MRDRGIIRVPVRGLKRILRMIQAECYINSGIRGFQDDVLY